MSTRAVTILTLVGYTASLLGVGLWLRRRGGGFADYVIGGGRIPAWMLAVSFFANFVSSNSLVGHASKSYEVGLVWSWVAVTMVVCCAWSWWWLAPRFARFASATGATTLPDFYEHHWGRGASLVAAGVVLLGTFFYVLAVMRGTALVVQTSLEVSYPAALLAVWAVTVAYCVAGGFWADVSTDVLQAFVLFVGAAGLFIALAFASGQPATTPLRPAPIGLVLAVGLGGGLKLLTDPKQVMVFYAMPNERAASRFRVLGPILLAAVYACLFPIGWLARRVVPSVPQLEELVPRLVSDPGLLPAWLAPVYLIAVLAASMSSLDSALLVMAACAEKHLVAPTLRATVSTARTRALLGAFATAALAVSLRQLGGIIGLTTFAGAVVGAALTPTIIVALAGRPPPRRRALASMALGLAGAAAGRWLSERGSGPWLQDTFLGLAAATLPIAIGLLRTRVRRGSGGGHAPGL
ncbi:MAG: sodium:solute symporter family protein [Deltaproteobacteria bacterium]|nr:sodium:solute symporter family protein [Deltaproteobacteria bacterium]